VQISIILALRALDEKKGSRQEPAKTHLDSIEKTPE
jgi:hypothetical protein